MTGVPRPDLRLPEVDAVVVGLGWAGGILAAELSQAGLKVVGLERGPARSFDDEAYTRKHDELRFKIRGELMLSPVEETWTLRHDHRERALPMRELGAIRPGIGVGGSGLLYAGLTMRYAPWAFELRSRTAATYGEAALPPGCTIQDWGVTYADLEPHYDRFEWTVGVSGHAGANPYEGPRSRGYPLPPVKGGPGAEMFRSACQAAGYHPFPNPVAILSGPFPAAPERQPTTYCGDCAFHACAIGAKADPVVTVLPLAHATGNFKLRSDARVVRVLHRGSKATGVLYYDAAGRIVEQPAAMVVLAAFALGNARLLLLSGLGVPYDPASCTGVVGRNFAYQTGVPAIAWFGDRTFDRHINTSGGGYSAEDIAGDNFDHSGLGFIGGALLLSVTTGAPISSLAIPPGTPAWGPEWKAALRRWYDRAVTMVAVPDTLAYADNHVDLDPTYRDAAGDPLLRITFDWHANERAITAFAAEKVAGLLESMAPDHAHVQRSLPERFDGATYQSTHVTGGAIMGASPATSVVTPHLQMWDCENVWVVGGSAFPQGAGPAPTATICALAYRAAESMVRYAQ